MSPKLKDAAERTARTFVQTTAGAMLALLLVADAGWDDVPKAALAGAFAGFLALLGVFAGPFAPTQSKPVK